MNLDTLFGLRESLQHIRWRLARRCRLAEHCARQVERRRDHLRDRPEVAAEFIMRGGRNEEALPPE